MSEYDQFSEIYDVWTHTAPSARANLPFYVEAYTQAAGPVVELGVGNGRIALEAAALGTRVIGVDGSAAMLALFKQRAREQGLEDMVQTLQADFREFELPPSMVEAGGAALISLPYHSLGHLPDTREKLRCFERVFSQLRPGGRFIYDDFNYRPELARYHREVQLRAEYQNDDGREVLLWVTSHSDETAQRFRVVTWTDELDHEGVLVERRYRRLSLSWISAAQARELLTRAGFTVEACYGDFDRSDYRSGHSPEQVWIARKPG